MTLVGYKFNHLKISNIQNRMRKRYELVSLKTRDDFIHAYMAQNQKKNPVGRVDKNFEGGILFCNIANKNIDTILLDAGA